MISRRDISGITAEAEHELLSAYALAPTDLIGQGTEAKVYALDDQRVMKVYADPAQLPTLRTLRDFYDRLDDSSLPYLLPRIHDIHVHGGLLAVIERRIDGTPMEHYATAEARDVEELYLSTVAALATVAVNPPLGRHMLLAPTVTDTEPAGWHAFLTQLINHKLPAVLPLLRQDIPDIDDRVTGLLASISKPYDGSIGVIHGDFFPGNVLMTGRDTVSGVIDFGTFTMIGDPLYDVAGACGFYRMYEPDRTDVRRRLLELASTSLTAERRQALLSYLLIGALLSCDLYPQPGICVRETGHYQWAAEILHDRADWPR